MSKQNYYTFPKDPAIPKNTLVIDPSKQDVLSCYVRPAIHDGGTSLVITDPYGQLYEDIGSELLDKGYTVKVLSFNNLIPKSNLYNPLRYIHNDENILKMIDIFMENTDGTKKEDAFWYELERKLLYAAAFYASKKENLNDMFEAVQNPDIMSKFFTKETNRFAACYIDFMRESERVRKSAMVAASGRLSFMMVPYLSYITSDDNIELEKIQQEKTAIFICLQPGNEISDIFSALFIEQCVNESFVQIMTNNLHPKYSVRYILNDFQEIGKIPDFYRSVVCLRRTISGIDIIIQSIQDLKDKYDNEFFLITGNCSKIVYAGSDKAPDSGNYAFIKDLADAYDLTDEQINLQPDELFVAIPNREAKIVKKISQ